MSTKANSQYIQSLAECFHRKWNPKLVLDSVTVNFTVNIFYTYNKVQLYFEFLMSNCQLILSTD